MKRLFFLLLAVGQGVFGNNILEYRFAKAVQTGPFEYPGEMQSYHLIISDDFELSLETEGALGKRQLIRLAPRDLVDRLLPGMISLSHVKLEDYQQQWVCELYAFPAAFVNHLYLARQYNQDIDEFEGKLQLVDGPSGCFISHHVHPIELDSKQAAKELKASLEKMVVELLEEGRKFLDRGKSNLKQIPQSGKFFVC